MNRIIYLNSLLRKYDTSNYLEIGVRNGENFFSINSKSKVGVDPEYFFSKRFFLKSLMKFHNWRFKMFRKTSDRFFEFDAPHIYKRNKVDVVFIDGMHTYTQSLKDAQNSLKFLSKDGVIIFHDCNPQSPEAATPQLPQNAINWNGDVWKTIYHFRKLNEFFDCFTINADEGLGVLKPNNGDFLNALDNIRPDKEINNLTYQDLESNRVHYLGLRKPDLISQA